MAAVMHDDRSDEVACVLIPVGGTSLLLPNVTVAEILPWRRIKPVDDTEAWCLGVIGWRGESIPVVDYERFNGGAGTGGRMGRCLVVMNRTRSKTWSPFYALAADSLPRLVHLCSEDVFAQDDPLGPAETMAVKVGAEETVIPMLARLEEALGVFRMID